MFYNIDYRNSLSYVDRQKEKEKLLPLRSKFIINGIILGRYNNNNNIDEEPNAPACR